MAFLIAAVIPLIIVCLNILGLLSDVILKTDAAQLKGSSPGARFAVRVAESLINEFFPGKAEEDRQYYRAVYIGESTELRRRKQREKYADAAFAILFASCLLYLLLSVGAEGGEIIDELTRPSHGSSSERLVAEYEGNKFDIDVEVASRIPGKAEQEKYLSKVENDIISRIAGGNDSYSDISADLDLESEAYADELEIYWTSSNPDVIGTDGKVNSDAVTKEEEVVLTAHLKYYECRREVPLSLTVIPANEESRMKAGIRAQLEERLEEAAGSDEIELPDEFEGEEVTYRRYEEKKGKYVLVLGMIAALLVVPLGFQKKKEKLAARTAELICDYPEVISKMTMLLESGASIKSAFERIASDYERRRESGRYKKKRYVYEEMIITRNEMALGVSETEAYEAYGRRCGNIYYIRLASLLVQNIKKGNESLLKSLYLETSEARRERQSEIRKRGEAAGIKLLLPMMGMLAIVMAIILIPAFMGMGG